MMVLYAPLFFKYFMYNEHRAICLCPFILLKNKADFENAVLINHEKIHLRQQLELLILPFYILYLIEFMWHFLLTNNRNQAYMAISFEKEAYQNQEDLNYTKKRKWYGQWRH